MKKEISIDISVAIILLCLLMAGCSDDDNSSRVVEDSTDTLYLSVKDGSYTAEDGSGIPAGEAFLKCEHIDGDPIDWQELTIMAEETDSGIRLDLVILTIGGKAFPVDETVSEIGDMIILGVKNDGDFLIGDYVDVVITEGDVKVFHQTKIHVV